MDGLGRIRGRMRGDNMLGVFIVGLLIGGAIGLMIAAAVSIRKGD